MFLQASKSPKFKDCFQQIRSSISQEEFNNFANLNDNISRFKFVYTNGAISEQVCKLCPNLPSSKSLSEALKHKQLGNSEFAKKNDNSALEFYNKAIRYVPRDSEKDLSILYGNRSAVLVHLLNYRAALIDIELALSLNYPTELRAKLYERKAKCLLALRLNYEALEAFKLTISSLATSNLSPERRNQILMESQIMVSMLSKDKSVQPNKTFTIDLKKTRNDYLPEITGRVNKKFPNASNLVHIKDSKYFGRFATANEDINVGDILVVEKASCASLIPEHHLTHCQNCFLKVKAPIPCDGCSEVLFCSNLCKQEAQFHNWECRFGMNIWDSGVSVLCFMALRYITQKTEEFFDLLNSEIRAKSFSKLTQTYHQIFKLVGHNDRRTKEDLFHRSIMALFLCKNLETTDFFSESKLELKYFIGSLLIEYLEILQFNAHEISELQMNPKFPKRADLGESVFIGGGSYPTLSLFNHSCEPGIIRYFHGTSVITRAAKNIKKGEIIAENYGPIYTEMEVAERRKVLKEQYWFDCNCIPCTQDWPTFDKMNTSLLRFRCKSESKRCLNSIPIDMNANQMFAECGLCHQELNLMKILKSLQETDNLFKKATDLMEEGNTKKCLTIYQDILNIFDSNLVPPFKDYVLCQQGLRRCMLDFGNKTI